MTPFKGKAIYNPVGKAGEYSRWACNFLGSDLKCAAGVDTDYNLFKLSK